VTPLTCPIARQRLEAFHDGELPVSEQVGVGVHLESCDDCAAAFEDLRQLRAELRETAHGRLALTIDEAVSFESSVVKRAEVEAEVAVGARVRSLFEDMHLVYAGLSAAIATLVCATIMFGTLRLTTTGRPDSLAAIVSLLSSPGSNENPVAINGRVQLPHVLDVAATRTAAEDDAVFAFASVVTREGRVSGLELLHARGGKWVGEAGRIEGLMDAVSQARFEPAVSDGSPVAVNMVWLVANTTVRPSEAEKVVAAPPRPQPAKSEAREAPLNAPAKKQIGTLASSRPSGVA
jgi:predicted anti-sigma-YlaC factor YlaD